MNTISQNSVGNAFKCTLLFGSIVVSGTAIGLAILWALERAQQLLHKMYDARNVHNSDVVLVLTAKHDDNGSLSFIKPVTAFRLHNQKHTKIVYKTVSSLGDIQSAIETMKTQNNRLKGLWIHAHGSTTGFQLGEDLHDPNSEIRNSDSIDSRYHVHLENAKCLRRSFSKLEDDAVIILQCCSTGKIKNDGRASIAQTFATIAPGRRVIAPTKNSNASQLHFRWKDNLLDATFLKPKTTRLTGLLGKIATIFYKCLHFASVGYYGESMTARHKEYVPHKCQIKGKKGARTRS